MIGAAITEIISSSRWEREKSQESVGHSDRIRGSEERSAIQVLTIDADEVGCGSSPGADGLAIGLV